MKINVTQKFVNLKGETIYNVDENGKKKEELTLGMVLADLVLSQRKSKDGFRPLKAYELAQQFYQKKEVEVSLVEFLQIKELVENNEGYITLITAQVIKMLDEVKE